MKGRIIASVIVIILVAVATLWAWYVGMSDTYTWVGTEEFNTYEEAENYQNNVALEAQRVGAKFKSTLSVQSPPVLSFWVSLPELKDFAYGKVKMEENTYNQSALTFGAGIAVFIIMVIWITDWDNKRIGNGVEK